MTYKSQMGLTMYKYSFILAISALCVFPSAHSHVIGSVAQTSSRTILPVINHIRVIREFKQRRAKKRAPLRTKAQTVPNTQTEAYLAIPQLKSRWQYELEDHASLINQIISREKEYASTHYIFYHGHSGDLRVAQDMLKELFILFNLPVHACNNFVFLRNWTKGCPQPDIATFFEYVKQNHYGTDRIHDHSQDFRPFLLSVSPCLFSNRYDCGECTFTYFTQNWCHTSVCHIIDELADAFGFYNPYIDRQLDACLKKFTGGQLLQICIPKDIVDTYVYASHPYGVPRPLPISNHLEQFIAQTLSPDEMDRLQARILITPAILDPKNDIHIHRYQLSLTPEEEAVYEEEIKQLVHELVTEAYEAGTLKIPAGCNTERLLQYMQRTP